MTMTKRLWLKIKNKQLNIEPLSDISHIDADINDDSSK